MFLIRPYQWMLVLLAFCLGLAFTVPHAFAGDKINKFVDAAANTVNEGNKALAEGNRLLGNTNSAIEYFGQKGADYITALEEFTIKYAPQVAKEAVDAALGVVRINGIQQLVYGFLGLALQIVLIIFFVVLLKKTAKIQDGSDRIPAIFVLVLVEGGASLFTSMFLTVKLFNVWNWIMVYEPKLWIAKALFDKVF